ncbi:hypothetical protein VOLCADRAFT_89061 [Volvox carteri f. nagariensis]|uniref:Uncharacterized protein n=1 Tax=Volvox carteri f. nagariensis TaxID=3068 RepID=D8TQP6_VOLCA|nr:uncharacterized protein VOLCADRAFT_89061 [Volvox carteri f. nagariensis]EFJ50187.1 hypothetical protein VOLCADRAFT_89061 [Volvox carteri f. nagariensis]|eukprot:XP_002948807.1 hypothetical protein VOLCADRAFT_89061 [Volvox carteri f. nagariensis]
MTRIVANPEVGTRSWFHEYHDPSALRSLPYFLELPKQPAHDAVLLRVLGISSRTRSRFALTPAAAAAIASTPRARAGSESLPAVVYLPAAAAADSSTAVAAAVVHCVGMCDGQMPSGSGTASPPDSRRAGVCTVVVDGTAAADDDDGDGDDCVSCGCCGTPPPRLDRDAPKGGRGDALDAAAAAEAPPPAAPSFESRYVVASLRTAAGSWSKGAAAAAAAPPPPPWALAGLGGGGGDGVVVPELGRISCCTIGDVGGLLSEGDSASCSGDVNADGDGDGDGGQPAHSTLENRSAAAAAALPPLRERCTAVVAADKGPCTAHDAAFRTSRIVSAAGAAAEKPADPGLLSLPQALTAYILSRLRRRCRSTCIDVWLEGGGGGGRGGGGGVAEGLAVRSRLTAASGGAHHNAALSNQQHLSLCQQLAASQNHVAQRTRFWRREFLLELFCPNNDDMHDR